MRFNVKVKHIISGLIFGILVGLIIYFLFLKHGGDVVAEFLGGKVERQEFDALIDRYSRGNPILLTDEGRQKQFLELEVITPAISALEAERLGLTYTESIADKIKELKNRYLRGVLYRRKVIEANFKEKAVKARHIFFRVKRFKKGKNGKFEELPRSDIEQQYLNFSNTAQSVIDKIKKGELTFEQARKLYGDTNSRTELGWIVGGLNTSEFVKEVVKADKTGIMPKPIYDDFGVHIVDVEDIKKLTPDNIKDIVTDPARRRDIMRRIRRKIADDYLEKLYEKNGIKIFRENIFNELSNAVVVSVEDRKYTYSQVISMFIEKNPFLAGKGPIAPNTVINFIEENIIGKFELLNKDALEQGIQNDPLFIERFALAKKELLHQELRRNLRESMPVSEREIQQEYSNQIAYIKFKSKNKKTKIPSLKDLRQTLIGRIKVRKFNQRWKPWIKQKFKDYDVKIYDSELWGSFLSRAWGRLKGKGLDINEDEALKDIKEFKKELSPTNDESIDRYDLLWFRYFILKPESKVCYSAYEEFKKLNRPSIEMRWLSRVSITKDKDTSKIENILRNGDKPDRMIAATSLGNFKGSEKALNILISAYTSEKDTDVKGLIISSIGNIGLKTDRAVKLLEDVVKKESKKGLVILAEEALKKVKGER